MKTAKIELKVGTGTLFLNQVTPPEMKLLVAIHRDQARGNPIVSWKETEEIDRSAKAEWNRLLLRYKEKKVSAMYRSGKNDFPTDFEDAIQSGLDVVLPNSSRFATLGDVDALKGDE